MAAKPKCYIGDGILPQIERYCSKYAYNKLTMEVFTSALAMMNEKSEQPIGNTYVFVCNEKMWQDVQTVLSEWLARFHTDGTFLYSKKANNYVKVGATYDSYEIAGNTIVFRVDRTFSREFGSDKGFGMFIDLTADKVSGQPAIELFTLKGADLISSKYPGVGGLDGISSGIVSSPVAASKLIIHGYSGVGVFNPYRSFILKQI